MTEGGGDRKYPSPSPRILSTTQGPDFGEASCLRLCGAKVCGADGLYATEESEVLSELQRLFGYSDEEVKALLVLATR